MILFLLPILSLTAAKVYPRTGANEALDGVEGVMYEFPDYEDPELALFKLLTRGIMPVFTHLSALKDITNEKDDKHYYETDDIKEELADAMTLLQAVKSKLENGNNEVIKDIIQSIQYLENLKQQLHVDVRASDTSVKKLSTPKTAVQLFSNAATITGEYSPSRIALRKQYFLSDNPFYKYFALPPPANEPSTSGSIEQRNSPEDSLIFFAAPDVPSAEEPSVTDDSVEVVLSLQDSPTDVFVQSLASTANPSQGEIFSTYAPTAVGPPAAELAHHEVKAQQEDDVYISKTKKPELGAKAATIYKKMTWRSSNIL